MASDTDSAKNRLATDLRNVVRDTELLLQEIGDNLTEKGKQARVRLDATLQAARETCHVWQDRTMASAKMADKYIHENPYQSIGVAFGVGVLIGVLVARK